MKREESLPGFNVNHIATVVKIMRHQQRMRYVGQWDRVENLEIYPHKCTQLSFHGGVKQLFSKWCWANWTSTANKKEL